MPILTFEEWVAVRAFLETGHPLDDLLRLVGVDEKEWVKINELYFYIRNLDLWWARNPWDPKGKKPEFFGEIKHHLMGDHLLFEGDQKAIDEMSPGKALSVIREQVLLNPQVGRLKKLDLRGELVANSVNFQSAPIYKVNKEVWHLGRALLNHKGEVILGIEADSLEIVGKRWMKDKSRVYCYAFGGSRGKDHFYSFKKSPSIKDFVLLNSKYGVDRDFGYHIYKKTFKITNLTEAQTIDYSVKTIHGSRNVGGSSDYLKDGKKVFFEGKALVGADPKSFCKVTLVSGLSESINSFKDENHVWWSQHQIKGADPKTFYSLPEEIFGQGQSIDKNNYYSRGTALPLSEAFSIFSDSGDEKSQYIKEHQSFFKDYWVFNLKKPLVDPTDIAKLKSVGGFFRTDGERIYCESYSIDDIDIDSFEHMHEGFCKDKKGLRSYTGTNSYFDAGLIPSGDPDTFKVDKFGWCTDKINVYLTQAYGKCKLIPIDSASFESINRFYAKDKNGVLCQNGRLKKIGKSGLKFFDKSPSYLLTSDSVLYYQGSLVKSTRAFDLNSARGVGGALDMLVDEKGRVIKGNQYFNPKADSESLSCPTRFIALDKSSVYYVFTNSFKKIDEADRSSFKPIDDINSEIGVDKKNRYLLLDVYSFFGLKVVCKDQVLDKDFYDQFKKSN